MVGVYNSSLALDLPQRSGAMDSQGTNPSDGDRMKDPFKVVKNTVKFNEKGQAVSGMYEMGDGTIIDLDANRIIIPDTSWAAKLLA